MDTITDFEDLLILLDKHGVHYLIIGGLAFTYHAVPRYTKDMDLWIESTPDNIARTNRALTEFGSPALLDLHKPDEILQIGVAPNRVDLLRKIRGIKFQTAWKKHIKSKYGAARARWIHLDGLIRIKSNIDEPRHQEDVRVLKEVKKRLLSRKRKKKASKGK